MKKKIILLVVSIFGIIAILMGTSYAILFKVNETDEQAYTTGILEITSESTNGSITLSNSLPMSDTDGEALTPYTFKITNTGNLTYNFDVKFLSTTTTNQISSNYIKIKINDNTPVTLNTLTDGIILSDQTLAPGESIEMSLRVWLDEYTPNTELGKQFNGKVTTEGQAIYVENKGLKTLNSLGLTASDEKLTTFTTTSKIDGTTGIYAARDDLGTSYYFRGNIENNYVYFAGYYWRIVRINGDGTVRMIYDGTQAYANNSATKDNIVGTSVYNTRDADNSFVGYMNGTVDGTNFPSGGTNSTSYEEAHTNRTNSTIKTYLDNWYKTNIVDTGYSTSVADAIYCNDRVPGTDEAVNAALGATGEGFGKYVTAYSFYNRMNLSSEEMIESFSPTLLCEREEDKFTVSEELGNGDLTYPVGLITVDEMLYGGLYLYMDENSTNDESYLYEAGNYYWTMSPGDFHVGVALVSGGSDGVIRNYGVSGFNHGVRPVITLSSSAIQYGDGTAENPFRNEEEIVTDLRIDESGANYPKLVDGLIPVMYDTLTNKWVKADTTSSTSTYGWYDYNAKKWANAVLVSSTNRTTYQNAAAGTAITESDILAYYVWIPRYKYKVWNINKVVGTDSYSAYSTGIDIIFEEDTSTTGTINCSYDFSKTATSSVKNETCTGANGDYYTHPAFTFGSDELSGIWVGKFEISNSTSLVKTIPNVKSLSVQTIDTFWSAIYNMQSSSNSYGLPTDRANADSHLLTNMEWGAVAYLTNSDYGRCNDETCTEVAINNSYNLYTGRSAGEPGSSSTTSSANGTYTYETTNGQLASTTGNIYGVYDMSGGSWEYVMGNMGSSATTGTSYTYYASSAGTSYTYKGYEKYITTYSYGTSYDTQNAYNRGRLGDATAEVVLTASTTGSWYGDFSRFLYSTDSWFVRGGGYDNSGADAGIFYFFGDNGGACSDCSSRVALVGFITE